MKRAWSISIIASSVLVCGATHILLKYPEAHANPQADLNLTHAPRNIAASSSDDLNTCRWEVGSSTSSSATAECGSSQRIVSGGCYSSASGVVLGGSQMYEGVGFPDDNEAWYNVSTPTGLACYFSAGGSTNHAVALCCGS